MLWLAACTSESAASPSSSEKEATHPPRDLLPIVPRHPTKASPPGRGVCVHRLTSYGGLLQGTLTAEVGDLRLWGVLPPEKHGNVALAPLSRDTKKRENQKKRKERGKKVPGKHGSAVIVLCSNGSFTSSTPSTFLQAGRSRRL